MDHRECIGHSGLHTNNNSRHRFSWDRSVDADKATVHGDFVVVLVVDSGRTYQLWWNVKLFLYIITNYFGNTRWLSSSTHSASLRSATAEDDETTLRPCYLRTTEELSTHAQSKGMCVGFYPPDTHFEWSIATFGQAEIIILIVLSVRVAAILGSAQSHNDSRAQQ